MGQTPAVICRWIYVFAFLCLVSNQRAEATSTYASSSEENPPYRVTRDESTQTITTIWEEDFNLPEGTDSDTGPTAWEVVNTALGTDGDNYFEVKTDPALATNLLAAKNTDGEVVWQSEPITITGHSDVKVSAYIRGDGPPNMDGYLQLFYILNGNGIEIPWLNGLQRGRFEATYAMADRINGSQLELIIRARNTTDDDYYKIDDIKVYTEPSERHAIQNGNWNDESTWSYTSAGPTCSCIPDLLSDTHIDGHTVSITEHSNTNNVTVNGGGTLQWAIKNSRNLRLWGDASLSVELGGQLIKGTVTDTYVSFNQWNQSETHDATETPANLGYPGVDAVIVVDQPSGFLISGLQFNAAGNFIIQGTGNLETSLNLKVAHEANITNDLVGNLIIGDDLSMDFPGSTFVNNQELDIDDELRLNTNNIFTNNKGVDVRTKLSLNGNSSSFNNNANASLLVGTILQINEDNSFTNEGVTETVDLAINAISVGGGEVINRGDFYVYNRLDTYDKPFTIHNYNILEVKGIISFANQLKLHNHEQANWYFGGQFLDADLQLFAGYENNTVVYNGNTNQPVLIPRDVDNPTQPGTYWHLGLGTTISTPGNSVKTPAAGTLDINGDLTIEGVPLNEVTLDVSANNTNINLAGDWWRYDKNATSFVAGSTTNNETVTFDGDSDQRLRTYEEIY